MSEHDSSRTEMTAQEICSESSQVEMSEHSDSSQVEMSEHDSSRTEMTAQKICSESSQVEMSEHDPSQVEMSAQEICSESSQVEMSDSHLNLRRVVLTHLRLRRGTGKAAWTHFNSR